MTSLQTSWIASANDGLTHFSLQNLPYGIWRVDNTNGWIPNRHKYEAKKKKNLTSYFLNNFHITVSGNFNAQSLYCAMSVIGTDRIMFSTDWPFENIDHAALWFDAVPMSENDRWAAIPAA